LTDEPTIRRGKPKGSSRKYGQNTEEIPLDGRFQPGNAGKPRGARHKTTPAIEALLHGEAEKLTRKAVEMALNGDTVALRLCLERICPPRRDRTVAVNLPKIERAADMVMATAALVEAAACGVITLAEAAEPGKLMRNLKAPMTEITNEIAKDLGKPHRSFGTDARPRRCFHFWDDQVKFSWRLPR
jgi:hypothetical protein